MVFVMERVMRLGGMCAIERKLGSSQFYTDCQPATGRLDFEFEPREDEKRRPSYDGLLYGAGDEARTRYLHLGKVALYRMSYTRGTRCIITDF